MQGLNRAGAYKYVHPLPLPALDLVDHAGSWPSKCVIPGIYLQYTISLSMPYLDTHNQCIFLAVFSLVVLRWAVTMAAVKKITVTTRLLDVCTAPQHQVPGREVT